MERYVHTLDSTAEEGLAKVSRLGFLMEKLKFDFTLPFRTGAKFSSDHHNRSNIQMESFPRTTTTAAATTLPPPTTTITATRPRTCLR